MALVRRALIALTPGILWLPYLASSPRVQQFVSVPGYPRAATALAPGTLAAGMMWTLVNGVRGPHDHLAGT